LGGAGYDVVGTTGTVFWYSSSEVYGDNDMWHSAQCWRDWSVGGTVVGGAVVTVVCVILWYSWQVIWQCRKCYYCVRLQ
jgi:hypothetical protein